MEFATGMMDTSNSLIDDVNLPNNRFLALKRLNGLKKKLTADQQYREQYTTFMSEIISQGYAEKVRLFDTNTEGNAWYIPHHAIFHKRKNKIRVVFDCSSELLNNLTDVLCRFTEEHIAFTCDIARGCSTKLESIRNTGTCYASCGGTIHSWKW